MYPKMSAKKFWTTGNTPPPTTIIIKIPDAWAVYLPRPSVARLKMEAHITEVNRPQSTSNRAVRGTVVEVIVPSRMEISGMLTVTLFGVKMAARIEKTTELLLITTSKKNQHFT